MVKKQQTNIYLFFLIICVYVVFKTFLFSHDGDTVSNIPSNKQLPLPVATVIPVITCNESNFLGQPPSVKRQRSCEYCNEITCANLLFNKTKDIYKLGHKFMSNYGTSFRTNSDIIALTSDCETFKKKYGYVTNALSDVEASFPLAYNLLMHRDVSQIEKLLRALYAPQNVYCIHVDARASSDVHNAVKSLAKCFSNVFVASKLERIVYAGISRLQADINCMKDHLKSQVKWKYLLNTAGQAFPLKTNLEIVQILQFYNGSNDIEGLYGRKYLNFRYVKEWREAGLDTNNPYLEETGRPHRKPPHSLDIIKGSAYGVFSHDFVNYVVNDPVAKDFYDWCKLTWSPDEQFWATLSHTYSNPHIKPPGGFSGFPDSKPFLGVYASWYDRDPCRGRWQRGSCVFGIEDLPFILSRQEFFINKLEETYQPLALECLEQWQNFKQVCPPQTDLTFYKNLPFIQRWPKK